MPRYSRLLEDLFAISILFSVLHELKSSAEGSAFLSPVSLHNCLSIIRDYNGLLSSDEAFERIYDFFQTLV